MGWFSIPTVAGGATRDAEANGRHQQAKIVAVDDHRTFLVQDIEGLQLGHQSKMKVMIKGVFPGMLKFLSHQFNNKK